VDSFGGGTFVRDIGVMTPRGLVVCNFYGLWRRPQGRLMRFIADFAPSMSRYPVVFDGLEENLILEGGDFQVLDERTLLVGCGNRTDPRVPRRLAQRLGMDVIGVQTRKVDALRFAPGDGDYTDDLRRIFLHLDTCLTRVADRHFVALPWFLEAEHSGKDPFTRFWRGTLGEAAMDEKKIKDAIDYLPEIGRIRRFAAGSGEEDESVRALKIVDWLRRQGFGISYVGGPPPAEPSIAHLFDKVLAEHQRQAANVVATAPGRVLAYDGAPATHAALRAAGVDVQAFPGADLARWNGGPHCLTMPLERG
jgi:arginine deiminase